MVVGAGICWNRGRCSLCVDHRLWCPEARRPTWLRMEGAGPGPTGRWSQERTRWQPEVEAGGTGLGGVPVPAARVPPATTKEEFGAGSARAKEQSSARHNS